VEEIVGKPISVLAPPDRYNEIPSILEKVRRGEHINHYETVRLKKDGERIDVSLTVSPIIDSSGNVVGASTIARDITERKRVEEAQRFLAKAGTTLSSSLDYPTTLASVANLAVPYLADWCVIDVLEEDGSLDRLAMTHQDPEKIALAQELEERYPPDPDAPHGVAQVLHTGRSELIPEIPEPFIEETAHDAEHREILRRLGLKSYMIVPLVARARTLGVISLVSAESGRRYGRAELELAEELAAQPSPWTTHVYTGAALRLLVPCRRASCPHGYPRYPASRWVCATSRLHRWMSAVTSMTSSTRRVTARQNPLGSPPRGE
jgi:GAF domain/PAS domain